MQNQLLPSKVLLIGLSVLLSCCSRNLGDRFTKNPVIKKETTLPIIHRTSAESSYRHELDYIRKRRLALQLRGIKRNSYPLFGSTSYGAFKEKPIGLAFSGGGLRSSTVCLGVMQGLQERGALQSFDYLSTVSGGSYISAWYVSHLEKEHKYRDTNGIYSYVPDPDLLLGTRDHASDGSINGSYAYGSPQKELFDHRHFIFGKCGREIPLKIAWWAARLPVNLVFDFALHYKPVRGKFNYHHPTYVYARELRKSYMNPKVTKRYPAGQRVKMHEVNPDGGIAPYLIINGAMQNGSNAETKGEDKRVKHFEFTRDYVGSRETGYVDTKAFGKPIKQVYRRDKQHPDRATHVTIKPRAHLLRKTGDFLLEHAVAASGAAGDSGKEGGNYAMVAVFKFLNLNLRYQTRNFSQDYSKRPSELLPDRMREVTFDRFRPTKNSNTLYLSDGAHYDDLGVIALVRRGVDRIVAIDASADKKLRYGNLVELSRAIKAEECPHCREKTLSLDMRISCLRKQPRMLNYGWVRSSCKHYKARLLVCKLMWNQDWSNLAEIRSVVPGKELRCFSKCKKKFPFVSTGMVGFSGERYDAYRQIGKFMGELIAETGLDK